jgi:membrane protein involved in colicin uptake
VTDHSSDDPMYTSRTLEELKRLYPSLLTRARDLGMEVEEKQTDDRAELAQLCQQLHDQIAAHAAGVDARDEEEATGQQPPAGAAGGPGLQRLRNSPQAQALRETNLAEQQQAAADVGRERQQESNVETQTHTNGAAPRKAAPKKAGAKKAGAKKAGAAKKAAAPKKVAKASRKAAGRAPLLKAGLKILSVAEENPHTKGTSRHSDYELIRKLKGKPVEDYYEKGGDRQTIRDDVHLKHVKVG